MAAIKKAYKTYAGIGCVDTPAEVLEELTLIAQELEEAGYILRTGGDEGASEAMLEGIKDPKSVELFLPWEGYNDFESKPKKMPPGAYELAWKYHPDWAGCDPDDRRIHARSTMIVLGEQLDSPVDFILCYTPDGGKDDDTGQAIRVAEGEHLIPVFDYGSGIEYTSKQLAEWIKKNK